MQSHSIQWVIGYNAIFNRTAVQLLNSPPSPLLTVRLTNLNDGMNANLIVRSVAFLPYVSFVLGVFL